MSPSSSRIVFDTLTEAVSASAIAGLLKVFKSALQDLEQAQAEAQDTKLQVEEQRGLAQHAQQEALDAQASIASLQEQILAAESSLSSATATWDAERASLEAAAAAAGEMASAEEIERQVQAGIAGELNALT